MLRDLDPATLTPLIAGNWLDGLDWFGILRGVACPVLLCVRTTNAAGCSVPLWLTI
jgi:hypothetical protein